MITFTERTIKKANFMLNKFGNNPKRYSKWALYKRWVKERNPPQFPFKLNELINTVGTSQSLGGGYTIQIRTSNRVKSSNHKGVLEMKQFMKRIIGCQEVSIDELASFIAVYTCLSPSDVQNQTVTKPSKPTIPIPKKIMKNDDDDKEKEKEKEDESIEIKLDNSDVDDWEDIEL